MDATDDPAGVVDRSGGSTADGREQGTVRDALAAPVDAVRE